MAEPKPTDTPQVQLSLIDKLWIQRALMQQRDSLQRSRNKEVAGSEIWTLRGKEIESLTQLMQRFS